VQFEEIEHVGHDGSQEEAVGVKRLLSAAPVAMLFLAAVALAHAQGGCVDSPEDPTVVLGLIAIGASFGLSKLRRRTGDRDK